MDKDIAILAIESSCDETAASVVVNGREVLSNVISSQIDIHTLYGGVVPDNMDDLLTLSGIGRKTANLLLGDVYGKPSVVTDTHCIRLSNRIGLVDDEKDPKKVEMALWKIVPPEEGSDLCHRLVWHGREVCTARTKPLCGRCVLKDICRYASEMNIIKEL